jgi:hypothetical protein
VRWSQAPVRKALEHGYFGHQKGTRETIGFVFLRIVPAGRAAIFD